MSPRAAWRLESLGFTRVFDYVAGRSDWAASGLPTEGELAGVPRVKDVIRADVPSCRLDERVGDVRARLESQGTAVCIVTTDEGIVLGRLSDKELNSPDRTLVAEAMEPGPVTVRADEPLLELLERMQKKNVTSILVTDPDGRLLGVMNAEDADAHLLEFLEAHHHHDHDHEHDHEDHQHHDHE